MNFQNSHCEYAGVHCVTIALYTEHQVTELHLSTCVATWRMTSPDRKYTLLNIRAGAAYQRLLLITLMANYPSFSVDISRQWQVLGGV